jgi:hypothetical protein
MKSCHPVQIKTVKMRELNSHSTLAAATTTKHHTANKSNDEGKKSIHGGSAMAKDATEDENNGCEGAECSNRSTVLSRRGQELQ